MSGQRKSCNGTAALAVDQGQLSLMRLYDRRTKGQTQAKAMGLGGVERFEQPAIFFGTDAVPPILHEHVYHSGFRPSGRDQDRPLGHGGGGHGIHRIHDKIEQDLLQLHRIAAREKRIMIQIKPEADIAANQLAVQEPDSRSDKVIDVDAFHLPLALLEKAAEAMDNFASPIIFMHNVLKGVANFGEIRGILPEEMESRLRI